MSFNEFIYEQGIIGVTIGTISGFAISNLMKDINKEVILKLMNYFKISNAGLLSSIIEFAILITIVYVLYHVFFYPVFKHQMEDEKKEKDNRKQWRGELLDEVKSIDQSDLGNFGDFYGFEGFEGFAL